MREDNENTVAVQEKSQAQRVFYEVNPGRDMTYTNSGALPIREVYVFEYPNDTIRLHRADVIAPCTMVTLTGEIPEHIGIAFSDSSGHDWLLRSPFGELERRDLSAPTYWSDKRENWKERRSPALACQ